MTRFLLLLPLIGLFVLACDTDTIRHGVDTGRQALDAGGVDTGTSDTGPSDSGITDAGSTDSGLREQAPIQTITYRLLNQRSVDVYIVLDGWDCTPFDPGVPTRLSFQCGCECPPPPDPGPTRFARIRPGGQYDLEWDGRRLVTWTTTTVCAPDFNVEITNGVLVPVEEISAPTRIAYETDLPADCSAGAEADIFECPRPQNGLGPSPVLSELCMTQYEVSAPLVLSEGDILIEVPIQN